ncbi:HAD family hydrolase [Candidatus Margulisiibacteriota bacterium]
MTSINLNGKQIDDIEIIVFDRDGTLIDLYHYWAQMLKLRAEVVAKKLALDNTYVEGMMSAMGVDIPNKRIKKEGPVGLKKREVVMQAAIDYLKDRGIDDTYDLFIEAFKEVDQVSQDRLDILIKPIPGMYELIDRLYEKGCKMAIATTDRTERAELSLKHLGIREKFDYVIGANGVKQSKPATDMMDLILSSLDLSPKGAVMVGDAPTDVQMGVNAGINASIGVCTGLTSKDDLLKITPYVINDISEIKVL